MTSACSAAATSHRPSAGKTDSARGRPVAEPARSLIIQSAAIGLTTQRRAIMVNNVKAVVANANITEEDISRASASASSSPTTTSTVVDEFDIEALRLPQNFIETAGVKKLLTTVPVRKPNQHDFNRVHPDPAYRANLAVIKLRDERDETYLLTPPTASALPGEYRMASVFTAINRQGVVFLWPVMLPEPDGRVNDWNRSAAEAAEMAMTKWIRLKASMSLGAYEIYEAQGLVADPKWPELPFQELLRIGFRDKLVNSLEHPLVKRLHGLA
jgi:hypothetical protein